MFAFFITWNKPSCNDSVLKEIRDSGLQKSEYIQIYFKMIVKCIMQEIHTKCLPKKFIKSWRIYEGK